MSEALAYLRSEHGQAFELASWVRTAVLDADPDLSEHVYRGWRAVGFRHPDAGYVCAIFPQPDHVRLLFEHGTRLSDPGGLLEGSGTQTRHVPIRSADDEMVPTLTELVRDAVAERLFRR